MGSLVIFGGNSLTNASVSDAARKASVSNTTVSHDINGTRIVKHDTRQRVMEAIRELGYCLNIIARSLTTKRTGIICILRLL